MFKNYTPVTTLFVTILMLTPLIGHSGYRTPVKERPVELYPGNMFPTSWVKLTKKITGQSATLKRFKYTIIIQKPGSDKVLAKETFRSRVGLDKAREAEKSHKSPGNTGEILEKTIAYAKKNNGLLLYPKNYFLANDRFPISIGHIQISAENLAARTVTYKGLLEYHAVEIYEASTNTLVTSVCDECPKERVDELVKIFNSRIKRAQGLNRKIQIDQGQNAEDILKVESRMSPLPSKYQALDATPPKGYYLEALLHPDYVKIEMGEPFVFYYKREEHTVPTRIVIIQTTPLAPEISLQKSVIDLIPEYLYYEDKGSLADKEVKNRVTGAFNLTKDKLSQTIEKARKEKKFLIYNPSLSGASGHLILKVSNISTEGGSR